MTPKRFFTQVASAIVFFCEIFHGIWVGLTTVTFSRGPYTDEKRLRLHQRIQNVFKTNIRIHPWLNLTVANPHNEKFEKGSIIIANHQSTLDPLCLLSISPKILMVMNEKVWDYPLVSAVYRYADYFPLASSMEERLAYFRKYTEKGYSIVMFIEGLRSQSCNIRRFHQGPFWLAEELGLDIIPLFLHGPGHLMPVGVNYANVVENMHVEIGKRITPEDDTFGLTSKERTQKIHKYYEKHYEEICQQEETAHYFHHCLIGLFSRIGMKRVAKKELKAHEDYAALVDVWDGSTLAQIEQNDATGVQTLLYAMVHPEAEAIRPQQPVTRANLSKLYKKCKHLPTNIILE